MASQIYNNIENTRNGERSHKSQFNQLRLNHVS